MLLWSKRSGLQVPPVVGAVVLMPGAVAEEAALKSGVVVVEVAPKSGVVA